MSGAIARSNVVSAASPVGGLPGQNARAWWQVLSAFLAVREWGVSAGCTVGGATVSADGL